MGWSKQKHGSYVANGSPRVCAPRKKRRQRQTQRAGSANRCPLGDGLLDPRDREGSPGGRGFQQIWGRFAMGMFFVSPVLGFYLYVRHFFSGIERYFPPGIHYPYVGSDMVPMYRRAPNYVGPGQWFKPRHLVYLFFSF